MSIQLDYLAMLESTIGKSGIKVDDINKNLFRLEEAHREIQVDKWEGKLGFAKLPYQDRAIDEILSLAEQVQKECEYLVVIGIGGSDLGTRATHRALNHQFYNQLDRVRKGNPKLYFVGDTTDPVALLEVTDVVDLKKAVVVMVSKSGNTIEQMSTFLYLRQQIIDLVGYEEHKKKVIIITDPEKGSLREMINREGYRSLPVPEDIGGRFSVLSAVGLFPLAVVGVDIRQMLAGARSMNEHDAHCARVEANAPAFYTYLMYLSYTLNHQSIRVLMPYVYGLREFGFWYRQLWAESLGKATTLDGNTVEVGPTPIASLGPTDQHSQLQLYMEGPVNKVITFITADEPYINRDKREDLSPLSIPKAFEDMEGIAYLGGHTFNEMLLAEQKSTAYALQEAGRPYFHIHTSKIDAFSLGELIYFFELAVTYGGKFHHINPFDQPAVEIGKRYMFGLLGRPGYDDYQLPIRRDDLTIKS